MTGNPAHGLHPRVERFRTALLDAFASRVECLVLAGSHARGDATPASDIDLWIVLDEIRREDLVRIGEIVASLGRSPEINPQCITAAEAARMRHLDGDFNPAQLHLDGIVIAGELMLPSPDRAEVERLAGRIAVTALMSARHYLSVRESEASLADGRLRRWVLKPLVWAIRYSSYVRTGRYVKDPALLSAEVDADAALVISASMAYGRGEAVADPLRLLVLAEAVARRLVSGAR